MTKTTMTKRPLRELTVEYIDHQELVYPSEAYDWQIWEDHQCIRVQSKKGNMSVVIPFANVFCVTERILEGED